MSSKPGTLTIAGSGIASLGHMTFETDEHLKSADIVFYLVNHPTIEAYIWRHVPDPEKRMDLAGYYVDHTHRYYTYTSMAEIMLREVRAGRNVLGIFYGHPGFFVSPAHRALRIARQEGHKAQMLPGVSSTDYLLADLEVEPARFGCAIYEASDLLARRQPLDAAIHNIILQVGGVGDVTNKFTNPQFPALVEHLRGCFKDDNHRLICYIGVVNSSAPLSQTVAVPYTIGELTNKNIGQKIPFASTFYIPPRVGDIRLVDPINPGILDLSNDSLTVLNRIPEWVDAPPSSSLLPPVVPRWVPLATYGAMEIRALQAAGIPLPEGVQPLQADALPSLPSLPSPRPHRILSASQPMRDFVINLALSPSERAAYKKDPAAVAKGIVGITNEEQSALASGDDNLIRRVMWYSSTSLGHVYQSGDPDDPDDPDSTDGVAI